MDFLIGLSEVLRNLALTAAACVGAWLAWERLPREQSQADATTEQTQLSRRDQAWELFNRSTTQLGDRKLEIRLGAIYTLGAIAKDFAEMSQPIIELLTAHLRNQNKDYGDKEPPVDVQEIMRIIRHESHSNY